REVGQLLQVVDVAVGVDALDAGAVDRQPVDLEAVLLAHVVDRAAAPRPADADGYGLRLEGEGGRGLLLGGGRRPGDEHRRGEEEAQEGGARVCRHVTEASAGGAKEERGAARLTRSA